MNRIILYFISALYLCSSSALVSAAEKPSKTKQPNVLLLLFDDMRFDTFSYRDGPVDTPNIDSLAAEGTRFNNAMTSTGLCSPSRAALFTGRWGHKSGLDDNVGLFHSRLSELPLDQGGLIRRASDSGYFVGYAGKWHLGGQGTSLRGAEYVYGEEHHKPRHGRHHAPYARREGVDRYYDGQLDRNGEKHQYFETLPGTYKDTETSEIVEHSKEMMRKAVSEDRPFFGVVSFHQPHPPYRVPEPYASMYDPEKLELPANHLSKRVNKPFTQEEPYWPWHDVGHLTDLEWLKMRSHYYGAVSMIDHAVGELIETAKKEGLYDDLYIVFVGDQGSMLGEHGLYDKGPYAYDELMRMPLIIRDPNAKSRTIKHQVSMLDIAPTMAEWMNLPADGDVDGRSLNPLIERGDKADKGRDDTALYAYEWYNGGWFGIRAIRTPDMKFVWNPGDQRDELYDLKKDPVELHNQIDNPKYTKQLKQMIGYMDTELQRIEDPLLTKFGHHKKAYLTR
jgi:arylsulfatase A-like enzyme